MAANAAKYPDPYAQQCTENHKAIIGFALAECLEMQCAEEDAEIGEYGDQDEPVLRDNDGEPVDIGRPLTRQEKFCLAALIASVVLGFTGLGLLVATWVGSWA